MSHEHVNKKQRLDGQTTIDPQLPKGSTTSTTHKTHSSLIKLSGPTTKHDKFPQSIDELVKSSNHTLLFENPFPLTNQPSSPISPQSLQFGFAPVCSQSLARNDIYLCLQCGLRFYGKKSGNPTVNHAESTQHPMYLSLDNGSLWVLPDDFELIPPPSLRFLSENFLITQTFSDLTVDPTTHTYIPHPYITKLFSSFPSPSVPQLLPISHVLRQSFSGQQYFPSLRPLQASTPQSSFLTSVLLLFNHILPLRTLLLLFDTRTPAQKSYIERLRAISTLLPSQTTPTTELQLQKGSGSASTLDSIPLHAQALIDACLTLPNESSYGILTTNSPLIQQLSLLFKQFNHVVALRHDIVFPETCDAIFSIIQQRNLANRSKIKPTTLPTAGASTTTSATSASASPLFSVLDYTPNGLFQQIIAILQQELTKLSKHTAVTSKSLLLVIATPSPVTTTATTTAATTTPPPTTTAQDEALLKKQPTVSSEQCVTLLQHHCCGKLCIEQPKQQTLEEQKMDNNNQDMKHSNFFFLPLQIPLESDIDQLLSLYTQELVQEYNNTQSASMTSASNNVSLFTQAAAHAAQTQSSNLSAEFAHLQSTRKERCPTIPLDLLLREYFGYSIISSQLASVTKTSVPKKYLSQFPSFLFITLRRDTTNSVGELIFSHTIVSIPQSGIDLPEYDFSRPLAPSNHPAPSYAIKQIHHYDLIGSVAVQSPSSTSHASSQASSNTLSTNLTSESQTQNGNNTSAFSSTNNNLLSKQQQQHLSVVTQQQYVVFLYDSLLTQQWFSIDDLRTVVSTRTRAQAHENAAVVLMFKKK